MKEMKSHTFRIYIRNKPLKIYETQEIEEEERRNRKNLLPTSTKDPCEVLQVSVFIY